MSGRLVILPKKSYCPWNASNVRRIERDEQQHRQRQEQELAQLLHRDRERQWEQLRGSEMPLPDDDGTDNHHHHDPRIMHFNLFEAEERREREARAAAAGAGHHDGLPNAPINGSNTSSSSSAIKSMATATSTLRAWVDGVAVAVAVTEEQDDVAPNWSVSRRSDMDQKRKALLDPMHAYQDEDDTIDALQMQGETSTSPHCGTMLVARRVPRNDDHHDSPSFVGRSSDLHGKNKKSRRRDCRRQEHEERWRRRRYALQNQNDTSCNNQQEKSSRATKRRRHH